MRIRFRMIAISALLGILLPLLPAQSPGKKYFNYEQTFAGLGMEMGREPAAEIVGRLPQISGWADGDHYLETRVDPEDKRRKVFAVSAADASERIYRDYSEVQKSLPQGFNAERAAATTEDLTRFIFDQDDDLYYYNAAANSFRRLTATPAKEQNARFSPDGKWIAYTRSGNLFGYDLESFVEHQYTTDGGDLVYNGWASWVYFEEILGRGSRYAAFWWSPDSAQLAYMRFDDNPVPEFPIYHADGQHGTLERQRYPKAGDANPWVSMGIVEVAKGKTVWLDFEAKADHYIAWPFWTQDSKTLTVQWMNRGQDTIRFYNCDPSTGKKTAIFEEKQSSWVDYFEDIYYFKDGSGFLLRSDVDGWGHLYYYNNDGTLKRRLTTGPWRVNSIAAVDEAGGYVYFMGRPGRTWDAQLMRVKLDGTAMETLTKGEGVHRALVSPGGKYYIDTVNTLTTPSVMNLCRGDGSLVRTLGDARTKAMDEYAWGKAELFTIPSGDGFDLPAYWVLPVDFDPKLQYPVIFSIYGGPDAGRVHNQWPGLTPHYWAQRGVITFSVDHRGSGHFGKKGTALMHRNLGKWEVADYGKAADWLRTKPFVAKDKVGITGSSYGGYVTMLALTRGADHFDFGQAGASVTDWKLYDTVYTERYMDTPAENPEGYENGAVLTWINKYKGLMRITHGTIDDNVHMQNSMQVVDWLTSNGKRFELMFYPDSRHGVQASQRNHATRETHDFWVRTLLDGKLPEGPATSSR